MCGHKSLFSTAGLLPGHWWSHLPALWAADRMFYTDYLNQPICLLEVQGLDRIFILYNAMVIFIWQCVKYKSYLIKLHILKSYFWVFACDYLTHHSKDVFSHLFLLLQNVYPKEFRCYQQYHNAIKMYCSFCTLFNFYFISTALKNLHVHLVRSWFGLFLWKAAQHNGSYCPFKEMTNLLVSL